MREQIKVQGPYNFKQALKRLTVDPLALTNVEEQTLRIPLLIDEKQAVVDVTQTGSFEEPVFEIVTDSKVDQDKLFKRLNEIFHWDIPLETIYQYFQDTELDQLFSQFRGTPFVCDFQLYGCLMKTIIHQQLNMSFAFVLSNRFKQNFGTEIEGVWFYPSPDKVSRLEPEDLIALQFSRRKAEYVIDTSRLITDGLLDLESLKSLDDEEVISRLIAIRGIGRWTAENFLMFGLGRLDLFPVADIGIQNGMKKYYKLDKKPSKEVMIDKSEAWKPYRTYASLYLWESLESD
ncbi:DNA-3-methyladenine glycosylase family protein [Evansella clarkii]|uniref:DNA-3-methyladenine glycosylase family protein n=1 Tax=Evansella clarkii TaxID=79879 RepID=UPI000997AD25|nr:DNA-3-methyladenine glycosylase [Evansella clarkii]